MGSKRKLASKILDDIEKKKEFGVFYDLFGGGGAISLEAVKRGFSVVYNELDTGISELFKDVLFNDRDYYKLDFVDRDSFLSIKDQPDWYGGFIKSCYSFGNNLKDYLYGKDVEEYKRQYHNLIVLDDTSALDYMNQYIEEYIFKKYGVRVPIKLENPVGETIRDKRLSIRRQLNVHQKVCNIRLEHIERISQLGKVQRLEHSERIDQISQSKNTSYLSINNKDYRDIDIKPNSIVYLDPPYKNTQIYSKQYIFDYDALKEYILGLNGVLVFMSGYECDWMDCISEYNHRSTLSATNNSKKVIEKLFFLDKR